MEIGVTRALLIVSIIIYSTAAVLYKLSVQQLLRLLKDAGCIRLNYKGNAVVFGIGIAFIPALLVVSAFCILIYKERSLIYEGYIIGICIMGFAGVIDDMLGERHIKGIKNHLISFIHGHLTTGFAKALMGMLASFIISVNISKSFIDFLLNMFNMALFANTLNLMDLRPGRCTKVFISIAAIILFLNFKNFASYLPLGASLIVALIYLPYDLKEKSMLGDTGSNVLGITLGYFISINTSTVVKLSLLVILVAVNFAAEKISISLLISKSRFLSYLDSIGRSS
jgi:hypothetical protein